MTEYEKMMAGMDFVFKDPEVRETKLRCVELCQKLDATGIRDTAAREEIIRELFGSAGKNPGVFPGFHCDNGFNIHVGDNFFANYNVTILDRAPVVIGDNCMIAPGVMITAVGHPLSPQGRRDNMAYSKPVHIGNDVWIGGNVSIMPGVTIGNNVVVAAGAVVTSDVPDNCVVGGVPARKLKDIENDV